MRNLKSLTYGVARRIIKIVIVAVLIGGADKSAESAQTIPEVVCKYVCPPLDHGLKTVDESVRLAWARWSGRTRSMTPPSLPGRSQACGRLPDEQARCCLAPGARLVIEYTGSNPYAYPETPWRAVCKAD